MSLTFPLGLAKDDYFCNRVTETKQLIANIQSHTHTVLISPRRYGKTSLAYRAISQCGLPFVKVDLYMTTDHNDIARTIIKGINGIIEQVTGVTEKILANIKGYLKTIKPTLAVGSDGIKLKLEASDTKHAPDNICEALLILNAILEKKNQKAALLIDEFQEIESIAPDQGIEGAIRHVAQETSHFALIFSGSKRHLLKSMFNDRNKPLYRLCEEIALERISADDYKPFINTFAKATWHKILPIDTLNELMICTERHPYYLNALLRSVFAQSHLPTANHVQQLWLNLAEKKRNDLLAETSTLTTTHRKLLLAIANGQNTALTSKAFLSEMKLAGSSAARGLQDLLDEDFIEKLGDHYRLVDPLLKTVLVEK